MRRKNLHIALVVVGAWLLAAQAAVAISPLGYSPAKRAMRTKADTVAGQPTKITSMFHLKPMVYSGRAEWDHVNPTGCKSCGYDPNTDGFYDTPTTEYCSLSMVAKKLSSGRIRVRIEDSACF